MLGAMANMFNAPNVAPPGPSLAGDEKKSAVTGVEATASAPMEVVDADAYLDADEDPSSLRNFKLPPNEEDDMLAGEVIPKEMSTAAEGAQTRTANYYSDEAAMNTDSDMVFKVHKGGLQFTLSRGVAIDWHMMAVEMENLKNFSLQHWAEVFFCLYFGGQDKAESWLLNRADFYATGQKKIKHEATLSLTAINCFVQLLELTNRKIALGFQVFGKETTKAPANRPKKRAAKGAPSTSEIRATYASAAKESAADGGARLAGIVDPNRIKAFDEESEALDEDELGSYAVVDPYENVTTPRKSQLLEEDAAKIEKEKERLAKAFMDGDQPSQVLKSSQLKFHKELDLISEHAKAKGKRRSSTATSSGPQLKATLVQPAKQKVVTRQLGPQCRVKVKSTRGHRCYEGYWVSGKLFKDPDGTEEVEAEDLWKCAKAYLENKIAELSQVCDCGPKKKPSSMTMLSSQVTFGHGPRFRTDVCVPIDEDGPMM
eukprot:g12280.t1